jgi:hypothetical protein
MPDQGHGTIRSAQALREFMRSLGLDPQDSSSPETLLDRWTHHPDKDAILIQLQSQEKGIPAEYQFGFICWWLGCCTHLQFTDPQPEFVPLTRIDHVRHPDIFAVFNAEGVDFPCLIEVKSADVKTLTMSKAYAEGLKKHPLAQKYPVLIAWRRGAYWTLFDLDTFKRSTGVVKVPFHDAMKATLLGILAGDLLFKGLKEGVEWRVEVEAISAQAIDDLRAGTSDQILGQIVDLSVVDPQTGHSLRFTPVLSHLLPYLASEWRPFSRIDGLRLISGEATVAQADMCAYHALLLGATFDPSGTHQAPDWKELLRSQSYPFTFAELRALIKDGRDKGIGFQDSPIKYKPTIASPCFDDFPQFLSS